MIRFVAAVLAIALSSSEPALAQQKPPIKVGAIVTKMPANSLATSAIGPQVKALSVRILRLVSLSDRPMTAIRVAIGKLRC